MIKSMFGPGVVSMGFQLVGPPEERVLEAGEDQKETHLAARVLIVPVPTIRAAMAMWKAAIPGLLILNKGILRS